MGKKIKATKERLKTSSIEAAGK